MVYHYAFRDFSKEHMARGVGVSLPISVKHSVEVLAYIKHKKVAEAKRLLDLAIAEKQAEANRKLSESLTPNLVQYSMIQKISDKIQVLILPAGQNFILDPSTLKNLQDKK